LKHCVTKTVLNDINLFFTGILEFAHEKNYLPVPCLDCVFGIREKIPQSTPPSLADKDDEDEEKEDLVTKVTSFMC
jgi:hypothetical protein